MNYARIDRMLKQAVRGIEGVRELISQAQGVSVSTQGTSHHLKVEERGKERSGSRPNKRGRDAKGAVPPTEPIKEEDVSEPPKSPDVSQVATRQILASNENAPTQQVQDTVANNHLNTPPLRRSNRSKASSSKRKSKSPGKPAEKEPARIDAPQPASDPAQGTPRRLRVPSPEARPASTSNVNSSLSDSNEVDKDPADPSASMPQDSPTVRVSHSRRLRRRNSTNYSWRYLNEYHRNFPQYQRKPKKSTFAEISEQHIMVQKGLRDWVHRNYNREDWIHLPRLKKKISQLARKHSITIRRQVMGEFIKDTLGGSYKFRNANHRLVQL